MDIQLDFLRRAEGRVNRQGKSGKIPCAIFLHRLIHGIRVNGLFALGIMFFHGKNGFAQVILLLDFESHIHHAPIRTNAVGGEHQGHAIRVLPIQLNRPV